MRYFTQSFVQDRPMADVMSELALEAEKHDGADTYISGGVVETLEDKVRALTGFDAAAFFITGTQAQQIALRIHTLEERRSKLIGVHRVSHLVWNENNAMMDVSGLGCHFIGEESTQFTMADLEGHESIGALSIEMPLRNTGGELLPWDELVKISKWCKANDIPLHLDGARLWESQPFYDRPLDEICALFDSAYVSFYKGLGAPAGAMLLGTDYMITRAKEWRHRYGGNAFSAFPYALAALKGMDDQLPTMPARHQRAKELAAIINGLEGLATTPEVPHANLFRVQVDASEERVTRAADVLFDQT
ncbi:MAG: hypothetical protein KAI28_05875, partial [Sphingomonadales bacterium]|nr:hypothetical protein [Sphingomonadales bacterium]